MANSAYARILVHIRKTASLGTYQLADFSECILDQLGLDGEGFVECHLSNNKLLLQCRPSDNDNAAESPGVVRPSLCRIMHPPFCPVHHLDKDGCAELPPEILARGVDVGVAVLLESSDGSLLLTRRAAHMRTFPGVWVPPGGHVEYGETLEDGVIRELEEETGLVVTPEERNTSRLLGLWESVYPPVLAMGAPKRHHIVVYLHITLGRSSQELREQFKLCPEEVDAAVWLTPNLVKFVVWRSHELLNESREYMKKQDIQVTLVNQEGEHLSGNLESSVFLEEETTFGSLKKDRVSTGSRFALSLWLEDWMTRTSCADDIQLPKNFQKELYKSYSSINPSQTRPDEAYTSIKNKM